jgi:GT2 family glycosyltransferase
MNPKVSIIVLNWNGEKYLNDCFTSLENQTYSNFEIILVDNGSEDGSVKFVRKNFPRIKIVENKKNLGFAEGNNRGIKLAKGEYIFILNNDTKIDKNCLERLVEVTERDNKIGMSSPKILFLKNPQLINSVGIKIYFDGMSRARGEMEIDKGQYNQVEEILLPSGCAALYRKKMLDEIGLFDENFFAYCEDTDLGLRGRLADWKAILVPSAIVYHHWSGTVGKYSNFKAFLVERNHFWVALKNFPLTLLFLLPFYTILRYCFLIYGILTRRGPGAKFQYSKFKLFFILIKAYIFALKGMPTILRKRSLIQKNKKLTDKEIRNLFKRYSLKISELTLK